MEDPTTIAYIAVIFPKSPCSPTLKDIEFEFWEFESFRQHHQ